MTKPIERDRIYRGRRFQTETIELYVRWYITYRLRAVATNHWRWPTKVNLDENAASHRALRLLRNEDPKWKSVVVRCCGYLNNIVEQDRLSLT